MDHTPPEIWTKIFWLSYDQELNFHDMRQSPWLVARVCQKWREIAHNSPILWTRLRFNPSDDEQICILSHLTAFKDMTEKFLEMSGDAPLRIQSNPKYGVEPRVKDLFMETMLPHRPRWAELELDPNGCRDPSLKWMHRVFCDVEGDNTRLMPTLRTLSLDTAFVPSFAKPKLFSLFKNTPSLSTLSLTHFPESDTPEAATQGLPWKNIRTLSLLYPDLHSQALPDLLHACHNVTILRLAIDRTSHVLPQGFDFPYLQGLDASALYSEDVLSKFSPLPHLEALRITRVASPQMLSEFVTRSRCRIQYLHMTSVATCEDAERSFAKVLIDVLLDLRLLSVAEMSLEALTATIQRLSQGNLRLLDSNSSPSYPLPHLYALRLDQAPLSRHRFSAQSTNVQVTNITQYQLLLEAVADFLDARFSTMKKIEATLRPHIRIGLQPHMDEYISEAISPALARIRTIAALGVDVDVEFGLEREYGVPKSDCVTSCLSPLWQHSEPQLPRGSVVSRMSEW